MTDETEVPFDPKMRYQGHTITVNKAFHFEVTGPEFTNEPNRNLLFTTVTEARSVIDKRMELKAKAKALKYARIVLNDKAELVTITGFTRSDGEFKTAGNADVGRHVYPNVDWLKSKIKDYILAERRYLELGSELGKYQVRSSGRVYRGMDADAYARKLTQLDKELDEAELKALEAEPKLNLRIVE